MARTEGEEECSTRLEIGAAKDNAKMKLPLDFATKFVFRLVFPGALLAVTMTPMVGWAIGKIGIPFSVEYLYAIQVIAFGWLIVVNDMAIYILFEGRRYWPEWLRGWMVGRELKRLRRLEAFLAPHFVPRPKDEPVGTPPTALEEVLKIEQQRKIVEASVELRQFPRDKDGNYSARHPTRLGNLIAAFESYPNINYGIDAIFYWWRLWVVLDKDLREELDTAQAMVDGTVYCSFVFLLSGFVAFFYAGLGILGACHPDLKSLLNIPFLPSPLTLVVLGTASIIIGRLLYCMSLPAHAQYGEMFKAVFDQHRSKIAIDDVVASVGKILNDTTYPYRISRTMKYAVAARYLQYGLIRDEEQGINRKIGDWRAETGSH